MLPKYTGRTGMVEKEAGKEGGSRSQASLKPGKANSIKTLRLMSGLWLDAPLCISHMTLQRPWPWNPEGNHLVPGLVVGGAGSIGILWVAFRAILCFSWRYIYVHFGGSLQFHHLGSKKSVTIHFVLISVSLGVQTGSVFTNLMPCLFMAAAKMAD